MTPNPENRSGIGQTARQARGLARLLGMALLALSTSGPARAAEPWPSRPLRFVIPAVAGGTADLLARAVSVRLAEQLGQPVIIDNKPGANTNLGADFVAKANPDGYTLCLSGMTLSTNPWLYERLSYDPQKDLAPVILLATSGNVLVVNPALPASSVPTLIALARQRPGQLHFGTPAIGATGHLAGEMFNAMAGVQIVAVHYKGAAPALADLIGGSIEMTFDNIPAAIQYIRSGRLRALGVTSARRSPVLPDVPTIAEAGLPGYDLSAWFGITTTAGTPVEIIDRLNAETRRALAAPAVAERIAGLGFEPAGGSVEAFRELIRNDLVRLGRIIRASGAKAE
jgi:tripartite-type tricarboxylate transporter receptor subunit TctC